MATSNKKQRVTSKSTNYYSELDDSEIEPELDNGTLPVRNCEPIKVDIPPIKILEKTPDFVHNLCKAGEINDYYIKQMSIGIKVCCNSETAYTGLIKLLAECNCQYFTHARKADRLFKTVLLGLEGMSADAVKNELLALEFECIDVKCITRKLDAGTFTLYIVSFTNSSTKLQDLQKRARILFRTVVRWDYHRRPKNTLVQCRNCQMFGHGEKGCHVKTKCFKCAGSHKSSTCNSTKNSEAFCANCKQNHMANDINCPSRFAYKKLRDQLKQKYSRDNNRTGKRFSFNELQFPPLPIRQYNNQRRIIKDIATHEPHTAWTEPRNFKLNTNNLFSTSATQTPQQT